MSRFEVHIPAANPKSINVTLRVDADHWMAALRTGLLKLGEQGSSVQNVMVDVQEDGSVHVTESSTGRVFQIREIAEGAAGKPTEPAQRPPPLPAPPKAPSSAARTQAESQMRPGPAADERPTLLELPAVPGTFKAEPAKPAAFAPAARPTSAPAASPPAAPPSFAKPIAAAPAARPAAPAPVAMPAVPPPAAPAAAGKPASNGPAPSSAQAGPRRDSSTWPWAASLSPHGQLEGAPTHTTSPRAAPLPRTPTPASPLRAAAVTELSQPSRAVAGKIGRARGAKSDHRQEIEDALADIFERVQDIYAQPSEQASLYLLLDLALEKIAAESGSVLMCDAGTGALAFAAARGPKASELLKTGLVIPSGVGIAGFCAVEGVSVALSDVQRDPRWHSEVSERLRYQTKSVLCAPMMTHGRSFGCIELINRKSGDAFSEHEVGMLAYIAHQGALYLNSRS